MMPFCNPEGYADPTAYHALRAIQNGYRTIVYICSPPADQAAIRRYCRFAVERSCLPIAPHILLPQYFDADDPDEHEEMTHQALILLSKCKEIWCFGDCITGCMRRELDKAAAREIPVRYFDEDCKDV
jgi:hypothetical protein